MLGKDIPASKYRKEMAIIAIALTCVVALAYVSVDAARQFSATHKSWATFSEQSNNVARHLNAVSRALGYGGFVHDFKNYVLRRDDVYVERLQKDVRQVKLALVALSVALTDPADLDLMLDIKDTFEIYVTKMNRALDEGRDLDPAALDAMVRVDDSRALLALTALQENIDRRLRAQETAARAAFARGIDTLMMGSFIIVVIIAASIYMVVLLRGLAMREARLQELVSQRDQIYDESPNALLTVDETGRVVRANRYAEDLLGYRASEIIGQPVEMLMPDRFRERHVGHRARFMRVPEFRPMQGDEMEIYALTKDAREVRVDIAISHFESDGSAYALLSMMDVTEQFRLQRALKRARAEAEEADIAKSRFLTSMSHEIRTPLNAILGVLQLVDEKLVPADTAHKLGVAKESGLFLLTLINQVLDFAKIEQGGIEITSERFSLPAMMNAIQSMFKFRTDMRGVTLDVNIVGNAERFFMGDFDHIRQILFNLTGNAVKFTDEGSIDLMVRVVDGPDGTCHLNFQVTDTGPGIPEDETDTIFEEFTQTDAGKRHGGGTGLGLSISRRLAEAMGGKLDVISRPGRGTTFTFNVDVTVAQDQSVVADDDTAPEGPALRVLVAEDNDINMMIVMSMLERDGHTVTAARNGQVAVDLIGNDPNAFDIVLMDVQMPVMDGIEATLAIRQIVPDPARLPIIALTANAFQDQKMEYIKTGMQYVLTKPLEVDDLRYALQRFGADGAGAAPADQPAALPDLVNTALLNDLRNVVPAERLADMMETSMVRIEEVLAAFKTRKADAAEIRANAHELAGMLGNMGMVRASTLAHGIERAAEDGEDITSRIGGLERAIIDAWPEVMARLGADAGSGR